ncbi:MAG: response regulator [Candidatus Solibacter usitatus]|nr:response regulator [Candidatus Solibacter usitatus]
MFWALTIALGVIFAAVLYKFAVPPKKSEPEEEKAEDSAIPAGALFEDAPLGYQLVDKVGTILKVNRKELSARQMLLSDMIGRPCWDFVPQEDQQRVREEILRKLAGQIELVPTRRRQLGPRGSVITAEVTETILRGKNGKLLGMLIASVDITERQRDQESVFRATTELNALFQAMPDLLMRIDSFGRVLDAKAGQLAESYEKPEQLIGKIFQETVSAEEGLKIFQAIQRVKKIHAMVMIELHMTVKDSQEIYEARFCPNYREEMIVIIRRITERRMSEEKLHQYAQELEAKNEELGSALLNAREATEMKSRFLANMSHEIRTPMNGILGMVDFLLGTPLTNEQREYAVAVKQSGDALLTLINDILDISKIEAGKLRLERIPFDLAMTVEEISSICAIRARAKGLVFTSTATENTPSYVVGDPGRLRQVLNNLIGNAIKFTEKGKVSVYTEVVSENETTATLRFIVQDTGIGISPEGKEKLFHSFVQGDNSTTRKYGGTGLGLAISKQLVEMMGGEIGFTSEKNRGSSFFFTVVFERAPAVVAFEDDTTPEIRAAKALEGTRVLLLTSHTNASSSMKQFLDGWQCSTQHVDDASELSTALRKAVNRATPFRLALIDLDLHGVNATAIATSLKYDLLLRDTILIGMTAVPIRGDGLQLREAGFAGYMNKPIRASQLYHTMVAAVRGKEKAPLEEAAPMVTRHTLAETQKSAEAGKPSILLAEDNVINQRIAIRLLQKLGLTAEVVNNGREAVGALERAAYDLVLMDCQMPELDGFEATAEIRRREQVEGKNKHTLICALTANAMVGDREKCIDSGMDDYISKPVALTDLQAAIQRLLYKDGVPLEQDAAPASPSPDAALTA